MKNPKLKFNQQLLHSKIRLRVLTSLAFFLFLCFSCKKENKIINPISEEAKFIQNVTIDSFVGNWFYYINSSDLLPYKKIIITKNGLEYTFELLIKQPNNSYVPDNDSIKKQIIGTDNFVNYANDTALLKKPHLRVSNASGGISRIEFTIIKTVHNLSYSVNNFVKQ